jgi:limonene-1,2-epoxide hydrolase
MTSRSSNAKIVSDLFAKWDRSYVELCASFEAMSDDCVWIQSSLPDSHGRLAALSLVQGWHQRLSLETIRVEIRKIIADENCVASERIDHLRRADGSVIATIPVVGIMDMENGKIKRWHEYFDSAVMKPPV